MKESIDKIIHADEKAKEILKEASAFRQQTEEELKKLQQQIEDSVISRTKERVEADSSVRWKRLDTDIAVSMEKNKDVKKNMDDYYKKNKKEWIDRLFSNIID